MKKGRLIAQIKTYEWNVKKQEKMAKQFYAQYKEDNSPDAYRQSQYYYRQLERSKEILKNYKKMLKNGEYEDG